MIVLNEKPEISNNEEVSIDLIGKLRNSLLQLKAEFISEDGTSVDYKAMGKSEAFSEYQKLASKLKIIDLKPLENDKTECKAFFINLYNVQMMHALVAQTNLPEKPLGIEVKFIVFIL